MPSSYLPSGVMVNCTLMTVTQPQNLGLSRKKRDIRITRKHAMLLNIDDKKISQQFKCKSPAKFWDGLLTLATGLLIGIMVVATAVIIAAAIVGTGGLAAVILAGMAEVAVTTMVGSVAVAAVALPVFAVVGAYTQGHACDCTLSSDSKWIGFHPTVKLDGNNAALLSSYLKCTKGGMIQPVMDAELANEIAVKFASLNDEELNEHYKQQLSMGFITGFTALGDPWGTGVGVFFAGQEYVMGNDDDTLANESATEEEDNKTDWINGSKDNVAGTAVGAAAAKHDISKELGEQNEQITKELMEQGASKETAEELSVFGEKTLKGQSIKAGGSLGVGLVFGIGGAVANHYVAAHFKDKKLEDIKEVHELNAEMREKDAGSSMGINANSGGGKA
jgi:uncharacterized Zn-binding protein involved in type VI secretion